MATYSIKAPNGKTYQIEGPDGATQDQVIAAVLAQHPDAGQPTQASAEPKRAGVVDSLLRGGEQLVSDVYSGAKGAFGNSEEAAEGGARRRQQIGERYGEGASLAGLMREYEQNGLGAAAARAVTDIPKIVAESVPELGVAAAGGAAGAKLGAVAAPFLGPAAPLAPVVGGGLGALAASMVPSYGRMITSQAEADAERGEKTSIDQGKAVAAAGADAALNVIGGAGQLGKNLVKSLLGIKTAPATASKMADAALLKRAQQTLTGTVARGSARGVVAEMPTEVAQTVVERWQAGQELTGDDAYAAYGESMYGGALGGAGVGGPANIVDRSQARGQLEEKEEAAKRQRFLDRQEPAPEYDMPGAMAKAKELQAKLNALRFEKVSKPKDEIEKARNKQIDEEIKAVQDELRPVAQFLAKNRKEMTEGSIGPGANTAAGEPTIQGKPGEGLFGKLPVPEKSETDLLGGKLQRAPAEAPAPEKPWTRDELETQWNTIEDSINALREQARGETDVNKLRGMADQVKRLEAARRPLDEALSDMPELPLPPAAEKIGSDAKKLQAQIKRLQKQADDAGENGDVAARLRALEKLQTIQQDNAQMGLFTPDADAGRAQQAEALGQEVGTAREQREAQRSEYEQSQQEMAARQERLRGLVEQMRAATSVQEERRLAAEIAEIEGTRRDTSRTEQLSLLDEDTTGPRVVSGAGVENTRERLLYELQKARAARALAGTRGDRDARNRATRDAEIALENLREFDTREQTEAAQRTTGGELAETLGGTRQPNTVDTRPGLIDARTRAFREYVSLLDRFNRGRGDLAGLKDAENTILENLIKEAEIARGGPLPSGEKQFAQARARGLLNELKMRFGDTRSDIDIGTRENPERMDESLIPAYGSQAARGDRGISRFESQPAGFRTFGNRYAAADSILEGLDELSNRLSSTTGGARVERSMTPAEVSPARLGQMVQAAKGKLQGEDADLLDQIDANLPAIQKAGPRRSAAVAQWLYKRSNGQAAPEDAQEVRATLAELEQGKRSETEQATQYAGKRLTDEQKKAVQGTSIEGREGVLGREATGETRRAAQGEFDFAMPEATVEAFDSFAEFDEALASPELAQIRKEALEATPRFQAALKALAKARSDLAKLQSDADTLNTARNNADGSTREQLNERLQSLGRQLEATQAQIDRLEQEVQVGPTAAVTERALRGLRERLASLQKTLDDARLLEGDVLSGPRGELAVAEGLAQGAARDLKGLKRELDIALQPFDFAYVRVYQSLADMRARALQLRQGLFDLEHRREQSVADAQSVFRRLRTLFGPGSKRERQAVGELNAAVQAATQANRERDLRNEQLQAEHAEATRTLKGALSLLVDTQETALESLATGTPTVFESASAQERAQQIVRETQARLANIEEQMADLFEGYAFPGPGAAEAASQLRFARRDMYNAARDRRNQIAAEVDSARGPLVQDIRKTTAQLLALSRARTRLNAEHAAAVGRIFSPDVKADLARREEDAAVARQLVEDARAGVRRTEEELRTLLGQYQSSASTEASALSAQARAAEAQTKRQREQPARDAAARGTLEEQRREEARVAARRAEEERMARASGPQQTADGERVIDEAGSKAEGAIATLGARKVSFPDRTSKKFSSSKYARLQNRALDESLPEAEREEARQGLIDLTARATKEEQQVAAKITTLYERRQRKTEQLRDLRENNPQREYQIKKLESELRAVESRLQFVRDTKVEELPTRDEARRQRADLDRETRGVPAADADQVSAEIASTQKTKRATTPVMEDVHTKRKFESTKETKERAPVGKAKQFRPSEELAYRREQLDTINARLEAESDGPAGARLLDAQKRLQDRIQQLEAKLGKNRPAAPVDVGDALFQRGQETAGDALSDTAVEALEADNLAAALNNVAQKAKTPINQAVAKRLRGLLTNTTVVLDPDLVGPDGEPAFGAAAADGLRIYLNPSKGLNEETLLHEGVHAATERVLQMSESELTPEQLAAKRELQALHAAAKRDPDVTSANAKDSLSEFAAEALSNPVLQQQLARKPWKLQNAWEGFKRVLLKLLGVDGPPGNMLTATIAAVDTIMQAPRPGAGASGTRMQTKRESFVATPRRARDRIKSNLGLAARTQGVDRLAPVEVVASYLEDPADAMQTMYYMRTYGQRMSLVSQAASNGAPQLVEKTRKDGKKEWLIESQEGASLKDVMAELKTAGIKDSEKLDDLFTKYLVGRRAANVGWEKLNFDAPEDAKEQVQQARDEIKALGAETAFKNAAALYNEFNKGMLRFMVQTGALSQDAFDDLSKNGDYVPFYRKRNGNVDLVIGNEQPRRIGNMKDSPHLRELVGGDDAVLPFSASAIQNVSLLTDLAVRNVGTRNLAFEMATMGMGKIGEGDAKGTNIIPFKDKGVDKYIILDNEVLDDIGVPADLLVKGLAGIPVMMPGALRLLALPSQILRKAITLSPVYAARQLFRDSTAAAIVSGANITPVFSALKQLGRKSATQRALEQRGITGGQVFTGTGEDISKILRDMGAGKNPMGLLSKLEAMSMEADAATRRAQYDSYIKQGLSEMEATMMSLESMNFTRQGLSPSVYFTAQLVPFLNAQIQGLDVLYRAARGRMPMNERLKIQRKMIARGTMMAGLTLAYTVAMQDDEAYKNATPEERAMSWFVRVPGFDEPVRIPIPFEIGYIFKALPEAVMNLALGSQDGKATKEAVNRILINTLPGGSNMLTVDVNGMQVPFPYPVPTAFKPVIEANTGVSLFTRRPIVNGAQADGLVEYQYNERTSEIAKDLGKAFGMSPAIIENTVRGYLSGTGLAIMQAASMAYGDTGGPERAVRRLSELPLVGSLFQPNDGLALVNNVYDRLKEIDAVKKTYDDLIRTGERAEAERFLQERVNELVLADTAGNGRQMLNRLVQAESAVKASDMTGQEKRQQLDELRRLKIEIAASLREVLGTR